MGSAEIVPDDSAQLCQDALRIGEEFRARAGVEKKAALSAATRPMVARPAVKQATGRMDESVGQHAAAATMDELL